MKKNILFIVIDSVTNDVIFNKSNSDKIAPFLNSIRHKAISGDKMFSEAPYTEAALMALLGSVDTMDNGGYMERLKNTKCVLEVFKENGYKVFFPNYYPSIYPSYMVKGFDEKKYIEGFQYSHIWEYRLKYFATVYDDGKLTLKEINLLIDMLDDNFKHWILYLNKIKYNDDETSMLNDNIDKSNIDSDIKKLEKEYQKFKVHKEKYLKSILEQKEEHALAKIKTYDMSDKVHNEEVRKEVMKRYYPTFKRIARLDFKRNLINNHFPVTKWLRSFYRKDFKTFRGLLAGFKNSIIDHDLYERISDKYDLFKAQRSFYTVSQELFKWLDQNKDTPWMSYVHIDDAHYTENFFTYDTDDLRIIDNDFKRINEYLDSIPKNYKGSITYDLALNYCDNIIKNIFEYLEKKDLLKDTCVVITADHGFSYYFSPIREKYVISNYRENYNVPFIVYSDKIKPKMINSFCTTKDIPATLLDLAGIKIPKEFKGKSLIKYQDQDYVLLEYMGGGCPDIMRRPINLGVRTDNYFVVMDIYLDKEFNSQSIKEIYDLKRDPFENHNLVNKKNIDIRKELSILENRFNGIRREYQ